MKNELTIYWPNEDEEVFQNCTSFRVLGDSIEFVHENTRWMTNVPYRYWVEDVAS